uniref:XPG N-terminal domain-containing protein n=1 Tax=Poecilia mexicana TaxID=48701 RepID=A0A3B3Y7T5_9TELE
MGVQGLASFLDKHRNIYREVRFGRSRLLVDGCSLNYQLYFSSGEARSQEVLSPEETSFYFNININKMTVQIK